MRQGLLSILLLIAAVQTQAQDDVEYRMEVGAGVGLVSYLGDFNGSVVKNMQPMGSLVWRWVLNPRMALRAKGSYGKLKGSSADVRTYYPDMQAKPYEFNHSLGDLGVTFEYNFWPYGTGREYRGAKRITPFIFGGVGGTYVSGGPKDVWTAHVPLGLGVKYKLGDRVNIGLEWAAHFSLSDKLDGVVDPYLVKSSGLFKNTDGYSALLVTLTYSFQAKCRTCHNDVE